MSDLTVDHSGLTGLRTKARRYRRKLGRLSARSVARMLAIALGLAVLPFVLLIRGGVLIYESWGLGAWPSLLLSAFATVSLLAAYAWALSKRLGARRRVRRLAARAAMGVAAAYLAYTLVVVASVNVKSPEVRAEYRTLHPLLRVASSALILVDPASVITDAARSLEDYRRMGLSPVEASLHFEQSDGFVHALDLRTNGRSWLRNLALRLGFRVLGFRTLRHGGTGDHLHVSLGVPGGR